MSVILRNLNCIVNVCNFFFFFGNRILLVNLIGFDVLVLVNVYFDSVFGFSGVGDCGFCVGA